MFQKMWNVEATLNDPLEISIIWSDVPVCVSFYHSSVSFVVYAEQSSSRLPPSDLL